MGANAPVDVATRPGVPVALKILAALEIPGTLEIPGMRPLRQDIRQISR